MEIIKRRTIKTELSSIGSVTIDGVFNCYGLEPKDRGLNFTMSIAVIVLTKVPNLTAVPTGRYRVEKYFSPKHHVQVPRVMDIPGFGYVEIHKGNFPKDTEGCLLLGTGYDKDMVMGSHLAIDPFYERVFAALSAGEQVWITYR